MKSAYENRLIAENYQDDVQCEVCLQPDPRDEGREPIVGWISEKLLNRLRHLALAYELPLLGRLPGAGAISSPQIQLSALEDELAFLFNVVTDRALLDASSPLREMIGRAGHNPRGWSLRVEAP